MDIMETKRLERERLLDSWATALEKATRAGTFGERFALRDWPIAVNGPRAGALELAAGLRTGPLLRALQADTMALSRQFIPWQFQATDVFMTGPYVRVEASWPSDLAETDIPLSSLGRHPVNGGRWLLGKSETGSTITVGLNDSTPHWGVIGTTGAGKTTLLLSAIGQLARDPGNRLVLVDAKHGASLQPVAHVRGMVGPLACDLDSARAALSWTVQETSRRYTDGHDGTRLIVIIDELQALVGDAMACEAIRILTAQGRGARVHVIASTQHATVANLGGPTVGRNLVGRLALRVADAKASEVAVTQSTPRADKLGPCGDCYAIKADMIQRLQVARFDGDLTTGQPDLSEWPETGDLPDARGWPTGSEVGVAMQSAILGEGRQKYQRRATAYNVAVADNSRAQRLVNLARDTTEWLDEHGIAVCLPETLHTKTV